MVTATQSTTVRTVTSKTGSVYPASVNQQTDMNEIIPAMSVYYRISGGKASWDTAMQVAEAMRDASAIVVLYVGLDGGQDARVLWPNSVSLTKENNMVARCYCTLRREWKSFRLDRMLTCHALTTPDDAEIAAA